MDDGRCEFFFNDAATTEIYTLALHDALPIFRLLCASQSRWSRAVRPGWAALLSSSAPTVRIGSASSAYARPAISAVPAVGRSTPTSIRMVVDLPAPLRPRKAVTLPGATSKVRPSTAFTVPCRLVSPRASITGHPPISSCPDPPRRARPPASPGGPASLPLQREVAPRAGRQDRAVRRLLGPVTARTTWTRALHLVIAAWFATACALVWPGLSDT